MTAAVPAGYMQDAQGRLVPESMVGAIDKLRDQTVLAIVEKARAISAQLSAFKADTFSDIAVFIETSAEQYDVKIGGAKGNATLYNFNGRYKVVRAIQENVKFDERLKAAKALIDECITAWSTGARDELKVLVNDAFEVDKQGDVKTNRVLSLRRLAITDERWLRAMKAIGESFTVVGSRSYVRVYERVGDTDQYVAIPLDVAGV
jgi:hypothetical protein